MSRLITEPNSCIRTVISLRDAPAPAQRASRKGGGRRVEEEKRQRTKCLFLPFLFQESSVLSEEMVASMSYYFFRGHFSPLHFPPSLTLSLSPSLPSPHSGDCIKLPYPSFLPALPLPGFHPFTSQEPLGGFRFFICNNHAEREFLRHRLKFARAFCFTQRKNAERTRWRKGESN